MNIKNHAKNQVESYEKNSCYFKIAKKFLKGGRLVLFSGTPCQIGGLKNYLRKAGASLIHSHSQILSLPVIPIELENEYKVCDDFYKKMGINMYEHIIKEELNYKERVIHNSENFLIFIPEVCKFTGDIVILFKENIYFNEIDENKLNELSIIMKKLFTKIYEKDKNCPFNLYLHCHPLNEENDYKNKYNVHIHIVPRKFNFGGFELSTGMYISSKKSEDIAKNLKFD